jgi:hypothetical protein
MARTATKTKTIRRVKAAAAAFPAIPRSGKFIVLNDDFDHCYCGKVYDTYEFALADAKRHAVDDDCPAYVAELLVKAVRDGVVIKTDLSDIG